MQLEAGKKYTDRRGRVYGPMVRVADGVFGESSNDYGWVASGHRSYDLRPRSSDLVAEYVEPVQPEYRMLRDGETIKDGDEYLGFSGMWEKVPSVGNVFKSSLYCPHRRLVEPAPVESPDDWVTQDCVPARSHDKGWWTERGEKCCQPAGSMWTCHSAIDAVGMMHGTLNSRNNLVLNVYCRRKDLPPVPPKTRTVVLKEWICWDVSHPDVVTIAWCSTDPSEDSGSFVEYDNAQATGETRTVEIPVRKLPAWMGTNQG